MTAYYNENDAYAAQWLRNLIAAGHIAPGEVDERSIVDVRADDLRGFTQCHFFAGIGVWSYALRCAGWPDDREVWTGSCPCQPFSAAGKGEGFADERHLWPAFFHLIGERRPRTIFGEQVASKVGLAWLDLVHADLEGAGYAVGAVDTCAAGFGAPHIRQRLYFVGESDRAGSLASLGYGSSVDTASGAGIMADAERARPTAQPGNDGEVLGVQEAQRESEHGPTLPWGRGEARKLADADIGAGRQGRALGAGRDSRGDAIPWTEPCGGSRARDMGNAMLSGREGCGPGLRSESGDGGSSQPTPTAGFWRDCDWLPCIDGKARPVEPGTFPLVAGLAPRMGFVCAACLETSEEGQDNENMPAVREAYLRGNRVGKLRAYGNAIVAPAAAEFIRAYRSLMR